MKLLNSHSTEYQTQKTQSLKLKC